MGDIFNKSEYQFKIQPGSVYLLNKGEDGQGKYSLLHITKERERERGREEKTQRRNVELKWKEKRKRPVLACSGCCNKNTTDWVAVTTNVNFSQFWRLESKIGVLADSVSVVVSWFIKGQLLSVSSPGGNIEGFLWSLFVRA